MEQNHIIVHTAFLRNDMKYDGVTVLTYRIEYPKFVSNRYQLSLAKVNAFYQDRARHYQRYLEHELYPQAVENYKNSLANQLPVIPYEAMEIFRITDIVRCIISLYQDRYEYTAGAHGNTVRTSQTWNLQQYRQIKLDELIRCGESTKDFVVNHVVSQIQEDPSPYFDNYKELARETFREENFYCTPVGVVIYYQQYDIAPYVSGIREFLLPYSGCVRNPKQSCFSVLPL